MNKELRVINAVAKNGDMASVVAQDAGSLFTTYADVWSYMVDYWREYRQAPSMEVVKEHFPIVDDVPIDAPTQYYIDELRNEFAKTKLNSMIFDWAREIDGGLSGLELLQSMNTEIAKLARISNVVKDIDLSAEYEEGIEHMKNMRRKNQDGLGVTGIPTNINPVDAYFGGLQPGDFIVIMGWTGSKKSWLANLMAANAWKQGYKPLYISLEMTPRQVEARTWTLLGEGQFSNTDMLNGLVDFDDFESWARTTFDNRQGFIIVSNEGIDEINPDLIAAKIEQHRPDLVVVDYIQLMDDGRGGRNETERIKNISKALKKIAVRFEIPIVAISSVTMETGQQDNRPPTLNEVAWSKQIAFDADLVLAMHSQNHITQVVSRKVRRGEHFSVNLRWDVDKGVVSEFYEHIQ